MTQVAMAIPSLGKPRPGLVPGLLALLIFILAFALFSPSLRYGLVRLDDITYVSNNTGVLGGLSASSVRQAFALDNASATMYMPLLWISYMLDVEWLGATPGHPWGFHFTNVLLHALNASLVFYLLYVFCGKPWRAFFFAALWAVHPLRVESVAWITERKDVLSGFFGLLCIGAYLWAGRRESLREGRPPPPFRRSTLFHLFSLLFFALGLLVKPSLAPLPFVLLLLDFWPLRRFEWTVPSVRQTAARLLLEKIPFFLLAGLAAYATVLGHHAVSGEIPMPLLLRIQSIPLTYGFYLYKTVFPLKLTVLYPPLTSWAAPWPLAALAVLAFGLLAALTRQAWEARIRSPHQTVGWGWYLALLLPVCGIIPIPANDVADRFSYFPAIGLVLALLFLLPSRRPPIHPAVRRLRPVLALAILLVLALLTLRQLPAWRNTSTLFARILDVFPAHATALEIQAGNLMRTTGDFRQADELVSKALRADPNHWKALIAKAQCLSVLESPAAAQRLLQQMAPPTSRFTLSDWQRDLARYALMLGEYDDAIQHADQALSLLPPHDLTQTPILFLAIAAAYEKGDMPLALAYAQRYPPYAAKTSLELADLLPHFIFQWIAGYRRDAYAFFQRLAQTDPHRPDLLNNVVWGLATADWSPADPREVLEMARQLVAMLPAPHPGILDTLAAAQANAGDFEAAIRTMQEALSMFPADANAELLPFKERLASRLTLYEQRLPYRENAFIRMYATQFGPLTPLNDSKSK
jgi:tetratricopeptide (TPR) repeat protein